MTTVPGYSDSVTCPYNRAHSIMKERFQTHLVRCAKSYPNVVLRTCPFNSTHLLTEAQLEPHVAICEDRASFDLYKYPIAPIRENQDEAPPAPGPIFVPLPECSENWDDENVETYDPQAYASTAPVIRQLNVAPKSERRAFREAERLRLNKY